jgi:hypothetical protein
VRFRRQFESAAREFYTATFKTLRQLRPNISWTHHAYPVSICYDDPSARRHNDAMLWMYLLRPTFGVTVSGRIQIVIGRPLLLYLDRGQNGRKLKYCSVCGRCRYELLDVIMPSIYLQGLPSSSYPCASDEKALLRQLMGEAGRMAEQVGAARAAAAPPPPPGAPAVEPRALPVLPIAWLRTEIHGDNRVLNASFFDVEMLTPFEFPYTVRIFTVLICILLSR